LTPLQSIFSVWYERGYNLSTRSTLERTSREWRC